MVKRALLILSLVVSSCILTERVIHPPPPGDDDDDASTPRFACSVIWTTSAASPTYSVTVESADWSSSVLTYGEYAIGELDAPAAVATSGSVDLLVDADYVRMYDTGSPAVLVSSGNAVVGTILGLAFEGYWNVPGSYDGSGVAALRVGTDAFLSLDVAYTWCEEQP